MASTVYMAIENGIRKVSREICSARFESWCCDEMTLKSAKYRIEMG
jgi:hypothetical protein